MMNSPVAGQHGGGCPPLRLKKSIVTAWQLGAGAGAETPDAVGGFEYVTRMCSVGPILAAVITTNSIKLYTESMDFITELKGHSTSVTGLAKGGWVVVSTACKSDLVALPSKLTTRHFSGGCNDSALVSSSEDGSVMAWDVRLGKSQAIRVGGGSSSRRQSSEVWSLACLGYACAVGGNDMVELWDLRSPASPVKCFREMHSDSITCVEFNASAPNQLLSSSEDGTVCIYDTNKCTVEDAVESVMNTGCSLRSAGFFGSGGQGIFCCSCVEGLSLWHGPSATSIIDFGQVSVSLGAAAQHCVGAHYNHSTDTLMALMGSSAGDGLLVSVTSTRLTPVASLSGGHVEPIRCAYFGTRAVFTGGEDSRICLWSEDLGENVPLSASVSANRRWKDIRSGRRKTTQPYGGPRT
jgi:WD40 repeat protein